MTEVDKFSKKLNSNTKWQLNHPKILIESTNTFGRQQTDLPRINTQIQNYIFWSCELEAKVVRCFFSRLG